jgi:hypothetical protein
MVTVMRQRSFHKPNGKSIDNLKAKGCFGKQLKVFSDIRPYRSKGKNKTKSMKQLYAEMPQKPPMSKSDINQARNLRRKLAKMKMPMKNSPAKSIGRKRNNAVHRPRRVIWPSERRIEAGE